jgi:hypothetical protein
MAENVPMDVAAAVTPFTRPLMTAPADVPMDDGAVGESDISELPQAPLTTAVTIPIANRHNFVIRLTLCPPTLAGSTAQMGNGYSS